MANVKLRIEITADDSLGSLGEISTDNMELANTSIKPNADGVFSAFPNNNNVTSGLNTLSYGQELCFNENDELDNIDGFGAGLDDEEKPVEAVWGIVNEDKTYNVSIKFTDAIDLKNVVVYGDNASKQFPTRAILDAGTEFEKEIFSDDYTWSIAFENASNEHTIQFTHWNRANYNAVLTLIDVMLQNYEVDIYNGLKNIESLSQSSADTTGIFYGSIESSGSAEILDKNGELGDLLSDGIIDNSNVPISILVNGKEVQKHIGFDSLYNKNSKLLSIELGNRLNTLDVLKYNGYNYPDHSENLANILFDVLSNLRYALFGKDKQLTEEEFKEMLSAKYDSTMTLYDYLNSIEVQYPFIESNRTYREVLDEFCLIAQMQMYIDDENNVKFVSARPIITEADFQAIRIPKTNMFSQLDYAVILKNKYDGIEASKTNVSNVIDYDTIVATSKISFDNFPSSKEEMVATYINDPQDRNAGNYDGIIALTYLNTLLWYTTRNVVINKKDVNNLNKILKIYDTIKREDSYTYNNTYGYSSNEATAVVKTKDEIRIVELSDDITSNEEIRNGTILSDDSVEYTESTGEILGISGYSITSKSELKNANESKIIEILDNGDDTLTIKFKILCGKKVTKLKGGTLWHDELNKVVGPATMYDLTINLTGTVEYYRPIEADISFYGEKRTILFEQLQSNTENIESAKTKVSLGSSNLIQNDYIIDTIKSNILEDYKQGISNATVTISCADYFDKNGEKVINWSKGEIPQVNQIVYFDNDLYKDQTQRYWKIKGRTFRKSGVPMVDLELEECRKWIMSAGLYYKGLFTNWDTLIKKGDITVEGNTITYSLRGYFIVGLQGILKIKEGIEIIGSSSFGGHYGKESNTYLEEISIASSVKRIEQNAFSNCPLLSKIKFEENSLLEYIGVMAFSRNNYLNDIIIPKNVKVISQEVFKFCLNLNNVIFEKTEGWFVADSEDATSGISVDVSDPSTAATLLVTTYVDKYFINKN